MKKIKIAVAGVGNCASSLLQGIQYYEGRNENGSDGLLNKEIGGYKVSDIEIVAAFDIDRRKVGKDLSEAVFANPNNTRVFCGKLRKTGVKVKRGPTLDGYPSHMEDYPEEIRFVESEKKPVNAAAVLKKTKPDFFINYLPVGSQKATEYYVDACLEANVSFINAIPVFICSQEVYAEEFRKRGLVCAGDDIKSQLGATVLHRVLANLFEKRGVKLKRTYQLNFGGNTDFLSMLETRRLKSKKISKTLAVQSQLKKMLPDSDIHIGPSDFIEWQKDNKVCFIRMEGEIFGGVPMDMEIRLSVEDSPNSAGMMIDVIRISKLALNNGITGYLEEISAFGFKHPKTQYTDEQAYGMVCEFMEKNKKRKRLSVADLIKSRFLKLERQ